MEGNKFKCQRLLAQRVLWSKCDSILFFVRIPRTTETIGRRLRRLIQRYDCESKWGKCLELLAHATSKPGFLFHHSSGKWSKWIYWQLSIFRISWVFPIFLQFLPVFVEVFHKLGDFSMSILILYFETMLKFGILLSDTVCFDIHLPKNQFF